VSAANKDTDEKRFTWRVEFTEPPTDRRRWVRNRNATVVAASMERAIDAWRERYPECTLIKVFRDQHIEDVILA
jgi:hypothetical protein